MTINYRRIIKLNLQLIHLMNIFVYFENRLIVNEQKGKNNQT